MQPYNIQTPQGGRVPLLLSIPHCGIQFPDELKGQYVPDLIKAPDDTDWYVDQLYDFAPSMGITVISAVYSRWVIDLNRDPDDLPLYTDGRIITGLCPVTNFLGDPIYIDRRDHVKGAEVNRRVDKYYEPYHDKLQQLLKNYQLLQTENKRQSDLIAALQEAKERDSQQINLMQEKITILKAAAGKMNEADKKAFEKNISQYMREIDKCIGLLSE